MPSEVLRSLQYSTTKSSVACLTRVHRTAQMAYILQDKVWDMAHALYWCLTATPTEGYPRGGEFVDRVSRRSGTRRCKEHKV
jgi:hypothetical protein